MEYTFKFTHRYALDVFKDGQYITGLVRPPLNKPHQTAFNLQEISIAGYPTTQLFVIDTGTKVMAWLEGVEVAVYNWKL